MLRKKKNCTAVGIRTRWPVWPLQLPSPKTRGNKVGLGQTPKWELVQIIFQLKELPAVTRLCGLLWKGTGKEAAGEKGRTALG